MAESADSGGLSERRLAVARLIVEGVHQEEICRRLDIARSTYYEWKREPAVRRAIDRYLADALQEVRLELTRMARPALTTLSRALEGEVLPTQITAARDVLDRIGAHFGVVTEESEPIGPNTGDPWVSDTR